MTPEDTLRRALLNDEFPNADEFFSAEPMGKVIPDRLKFERNAAVSAWMTRASGRDVNPAATDWQASKDALAQGFFKMPTAKDVTDETIHGLIKSHIQTADNSTEMALTAALSGRPLPETLAELNSLTGVSPTRGIRDMYTQDASRIYGNVAAKIAPYRTLIDDVAGTLGKEMKSAMPTTDAFQKVADALLAVPVEDRPMVINAIGKTGGATAEERSGYLSKLAGAIGRITEAVGASVAGSMTEAAFSESATSLREAGNFGFAKEMEGEADKQGEYRILTQMIRQTADSEINPIKGESWLGQLGIDVARMVPQTAITIANPAVGFAANLTYFQDTQAAQAMMEDPNLTYKQAQAITVLSAPVSAAAETITALIPFGKVKLPYLSKWIQATTTTTGGALKNLGIRAAAGTVGEIGEEYAQAAAPLISQELLGALSADMPDVDWEGRMPDFSKIAEQTWAPALVFSLVGAGATSMMDVKNGRTLASDMDLMVASGIKPELAEKIKTASDAGNWSQVDGLFREDFTTPTDKKATEEERTQATTRLTERVRAMTASEKVNWDSPDYTVSVTRGASGWRVETGDGQVIPVESAEAARRIAVDLKQVSSQQEADALVGIIDKYHDPKSEVTLSGETVGASNAGVFAMRDGKSRVLSADSLETIRKEAENIGIQTGTEGIFAHVNGSNFVFADKVGKGAKEVIKLLNLYQSQGGGQPQVITFFHENIESSFELGLRTGAINEAEVRAGFAALTPALDLARVRKGDDLERKLFENVHTLAAGGGDATMLRETFSELAVRDAFARDRSNKTAGRPGSFSRAIEAAVMGAKTQEEATILVRFRALLKAFSTYLKGVLRTVGEIKRGREKGLIGEDWDALIDKVTGLDETKLLEHQAAEQAVKDVQAAGNMAFSVSPVTPAQDSEYLAAVERGDMEKAQRMVDEAAKAAGYDIGPMFHGGADGFNVFSFDKMGEQGTSEGMGFYFTNQEQVARGYVKEQGGRLMRVWLKNGKRLNSKKITINKAQLAKVLRKIDPKGDDFLTNYGDVGYEGYSKVLNDAVSNLLDYSESDVDLIGGIINSGASPQQLYKFIEEVTGKSGMVTTAEDGGWGEAGHVITVITSPEYVKLADPVTRDESGQVIPLSERFNEASSDIRFSISAITNLEEVQEAIYQRMTQRPEEALRVWSNATRKIQKLIQRNRDGGWTWDGKRIREISDKRTVKSLDKEQAMREATRESELIDEGLATLTPETMLAYSEGVGTLEDDPLIAKMLHDNGKLMSKSTAEREGRGIKDLYDDAPWIPPSWYARGSGGIMPDVMANNLGFDSASEMWAALDSSIKSHRSAKEGYAKAEKAVRDVERSAKEKAKAEAQEWRDEANAMQSEDWNPREAMIRDLVAYEAILSTMPKEIRGQLSGGFVALARKGSEAGRGKVIKKKVELMAKLLERHFKKKLFEKIENQFEKYGSEVGKAGQQESKLTTETSGDVDFARRFSNMPVTLPADSTEKSQDAVIGDLEKVIEESEDQDAVEAARDTLAIANLFYDMAKMDASELESAALWLDSTIAGGLESRKAIKEARKAYLDERRGRAKKDVLKGSPSSLVEAENAKAEIHSSGWKQFVSDVKGYIDSVIWTAAHQLEIIFGKKSQLTEEFHGRLVRAANQETDIQIEFEARRKIASEAIFGTGSTISQAGKMGKLQQARKSGVIVELDAKTKTEKIESEIVESILNGDAEASEFGIDTMTMEALADQWADNQALPGNRRKKWLTWEKIESAGRPVEIEMSEADGIQYLLQSQQKQSREQMERDGWSKASFEQLEAFLSPEAKAWAIFLSAEYERAGKIVAPVFERIFQTPFPVVPDYVPMSRDVANVDGMAPLDGQTSKGGIESGFTKSRNKKARAELKRVDAFLSYLAHIDHFSHWVSFVEVTRDMKAIFNDVSVQNAITTKGGQENGTALRTRIKALENKGLDDANSLHTINNIFTRLNTLRAFKGLAFRLSPILKQFSAWANPLLGDVPAWAYLRGHARLMAGKIDVSGMFKSADIRRRIEQGFSPEARIAQKRLGMTGSQMIAIMGKGMRGMTLADAGLTGIGAAISFDFYRSQNEKAGMSKPDAEFEARRQLEILIAETAQPADQVNRSLLESTKNPAVQALLMFISEQRKVAAIELMAIRNLATGNSVNKAMDVQRIIVAHGISTLMTQTMVGVLALLMGDDDDVEREWSVEQWASSFIAGPINGIFILGRGVQMGINRLFKLRTFQNTQPYEKIFDDVYNAGKNLGDLKDGDAEEIRKEYLRLLTATSAAIATVAGPANPVTALDVLSNAAKDVGDVMTRD